VVERLLRGVRREGRAVLVVVDEVALLYAGALDYPGIIGIQNLLKVVVGNRPAP
jgi:hypothetical protein